MRYIHLKLAETVEDKERAERLPKLTESQLKRLIANTEKTKIYTEKTKEASRRQHIVVKKKIFKEVAKLLADKKHYLAKHFSKGYDPNNKPPVYKSKDDIFQLDGISGMANDFFFIKQYREDKNYDIRDYKNLYEKVSKKIPGSPKDIKEKFATLPKKISKTRDFKLSDLDFLSEVAFQLFRPGNIVSTGIILTPLEEEGEGDKTDRYDKQSCREQDPQPNPKGLLTIHNWTLKPHLTSTKNQDHPRGTCTAFGMIAAIETKISFKYHKKVNLCEQDLYKKNKLDWNPNIWDDYLTDGDSGITSGLLQLLKGYTFPFEKDWAYNRSHNRTLENGKFLHSCDNYGGVACSETNHQANKVCNAVDVVIAKAVVNMACKTITSFPFVGDITGGWICDSLNEWVDQRTGTVIVCTYDTEIPGSSGYKLQQFSLVWDPLFGTDFIRARLALMEGSALVIGINVPNSLEALSPANGKGYIVYSETEPEPESPAQHTMAVVGFADNDDLLGMALPEGEGGGYFIIKNSYGKCHGDMGYYYAPYSWVRKWGIGMLEISDVQHI